MTVGTETTSAARRTGWWTEPTPVLQSNPMQAADQALALWTEIANAALAFWANVTVPAVNGHRLAIATGSTAGGPLAAKRSPDASWYRAPLGVQDSASGAMGYFAGPFAMLLPAFTANPFWQPAAGAFWPTPATMPKAMPLALLQSAIENNPWARLWAQSLPPGLLTTAFTGGHPAMAPTAIAQIEAMTYPAYQSDSGHAVAQIIRTGANALVAILPMLAFVVGLLIAAQQGPGGLMA